jgi:L-asparaginase
MASTDGITVILGTGGTIAGLAPSATDNVAYTAAQLSIQALVAAVPPFATLQIEAEQVAQLDSKDMTHAVWYALAQRVAAHLGRPEVAGVVVTHGTDTLEETAYFLHRVLGPAKPVVLTAAMRPATSLQADGPQNLLDAVTVAREGGARGVVAVLAGRVHPGACVRKVHTYRADAFDSGDAGPVALVVEGAVRVLRDWPGPEPAATLDRLPADTQSWPRVDVVMSHAGADGAVVDALVASGVRGIVVAGTGNGTLHGLLEEAIVRAQRAGVVTVRVSRCPLGPLIDHGAHSVPSIDGASAAQARVELMLRLMGA